MSISRRNFLKGAAGSGVLLATGAPAAQARMSKELPPEAVGLLYDATLCIGCKSCVVNCKRANSVPGGALYKEGLVPAVADSFLCTKSEKNAPMTPPYETSGLKGNEGVWDAAQDLTGNTLSVIKVYKNGTGLQKDAAVNGHAFFKQQCLHCITPACVSVCPAGAFRKDPHDGTVYYEAYRCIGCRYCQIGCPFNVPRYEWGAVWPEVRKCQLCRHRYQEGKYAACAESCPTGATIFGKVRDLREEAKRRFAMKAGTMYEYPIQTLGSTFTNLRPSAAYADRVYGLTEAGGTQNLMLSGISFDLLGFNKDIPSSALPDLTWAYIAKIPWVFLGVFLGGTALHQITSRMNHSDKEGRHD
ncbi:hydrogenase 2 operon protein HybA [Geomonas sp. Red32]|uniref:hydrogenase 2 operon protein HybA n=1 Tax=Geomonas sp. Red32 TaxID=2912856 RepID=UPI00202CEF12|nr:hydrogenase 2 operon protein HybA [Geomonas sp. Red32]MCM0082128.1 hydrogenase 2 operon protein HybA [Geomonas sp. Red32]